LESSCSKKGTWAVYMLSVQLRFEHGQCTLTIESLLDILIHYLNGNQSINPSFTLQLESGERPLLGLEICIRHTCLTFHLWCKITGDTTKKNYGVVTKKNPSILLLHWRTIVTNNRFCQMQLQPCCLDPLPLLPPIGLDTQRHENEVNQIFTCVPSMFHLNAGRRMVVAALPCPGGGIDLDMQRRLHRSCEWPPSVMASPRTSARDLACRGACWCSWPGRMMLPRPNSISQTKSTEFWGFFLNFSKKSTICQKLPRNSNFGPNLVEFS
jgi:hypothetical protein